MMSSSHNSIYKLEWCKWHKKADSQFNDLLNLSELYNLGIYSKLYTQNIVILTQILYAT